jgi:aryl carrier-like protein
VHGVLGTDTPLEDDANLLDAGVDSLSAQEIRKTLADNLRITLAPLIIFEHPTIACIGEHLN